MVKVTNTKKKKVTFWNPEKFELRLEQMRELYQVRGRELNAYIVYQLLSAVLLNQN